VGYYFEGLTMRDYIEIGCTPTEETCYPAGHPLALAECRVYLRQLQRTFPKAELQIRKNPHDFGTYYEVAAYYDCDSEEATQAAFDAECGCDKWDFIAIQEIKELKERASA
jgi:hypothetical protein